MEPVCALGEGVKSVLDPGLGNGQLADELSSERKVGRVEEKRKWGTTAGDSRQTAA